MTGLGAGRTIYWQLPQLPSLLLPLLPPAAQLLCIRLPSVPVGGSSTRTSALCRGAVAGCCPLPRFQAHRPLRPQPCGLARGAIARSRSTPCSATSVARGVDEARVRGPSFAPS